jgi:glycosyltransferase involved in cell wall biosynthesis
MSSLSEPLVSILIPTYARAGYVTQAVRSALAQSHQTIEVLVLDDASPDNTSEELLAFQSNPRLHYIRHGKNLGIAGNWRFGIAAAKGEYFCLLHDDDTIEPDFVQTLLQPFLVDPQLALVFCDHFVMDVTGQRLSNAGTTTRFHRDTLPTGRLSYDAFVRAVLVDFAVPVGASLFRRGSVRIDFLDERAKGAIDYWLLYQILKTGQAAYYIPSRLMNYRSHGGGMSARSTIYMAEGHLFRFDAILADLTFSALHSVVAARRRESLTGYGIDLAQIGRYSEASRALWNVLREKPTLRACVAFVLSLLRLPGSWLIARLRAQST